MVGTVHLNRLIHMCGEILKAQNWQMLMHLLFFAYILIKISDVQLQ